MKSLMLLMIFLFVLNNAQSQKRPETMNVRNTDNKYEGSGIGKISIANQLDKSLKDYFLITDTIDFEHNQWDLVYVEGFDIHFRLRIHRDSTVVEASNKIWLILESHIPPYPLLEYDITSLDNDEVVRISRNLREMEYDTPMLRQAFQNCMSYALEGIFNSHGIETEPFFFRRSVPAEVDGLEIILENLFIKIETLNNVRRKTLNRSKHLQEDQVFILLRNLRGEPIHAFFNLTGRTWTKNGNGPYTSQLTPFPVIETYNSKKRIKSNFSEATKELLTLGSVHSIEIYRLNFDIFN